MTCRVYWQRAACHPRLKATLTPPLGCSHPAFIMIIMIIIFNIQVLLLRLKFKIPCHCSLDSGHKHQHHHEHSPQHHWIQLHSKKTKTFCYSRVICGFIINIIIAVMLKHVLPNMTKNIAVSAGLSDRKEVRGINLIENPNAGKYLSRVHHNFKYSSRSANAGLKKYERYNTTNCNDPKFIIFLWRFSTFQDDCHKGPQSQRKIWIISWERWFNREKVKDVVSVCLMGPMIWLFCSENVHLYQSWFILYAHICGTRCTLLNIIYQLLSH